jgi:hypothetical protein
MKDSENNLSIRILLASLAPARELGLEKVEGGRPGEQERMVAEPIRDHITTPSIPLSDGAELRLNKTNRLRGGGS